MPDNHPDARAVSDSINVEARRRANEACSVLLNELTSLAAAYGDASKAYHELWAGVYSKERASGRRCQDTVT